MGGGVGGSGWSSQPPICPRAPPASSAGRAGPAQPGPAAGRSPLPPPVRGGAGLRRDGEPTAPLPAPPGPTRRQIMPRTVRGNATAASPPRTVPETVRPRGERRVPPAPCSGPEGRKRPRRAPQGPRVAAWRGPGGHRLHLLGGALPRRPPPRDAATSPPAWPQPPGRRWHAARRATFCCCAAPAAAAPSPDAARHSVLLYSSPQSAAAPPRAPPPVRRRAPCWAVSGGAPRGSPHPRAPGPGTPPRHGNDANAASAAARPEEEQEDPGRGRGRQLRRDGKQAAASALASGVSPARSRIKALAFPPRAASSFRLTAAEGCSAVAKPAESKRELSRPRRGCHGRSRYSITGPALPHRHAWCCQSCVGAVPCCRPRSQTIGAAAGKRGQTASPRAGSRDLTRVYCGNALTDLGTGEPAPLPLLTHRTTPVNTPREEPLQLGGR